MAADFRFVANAAERHPDELPPGGARNRLADRGLARTRRSDQGEDDPRPAVLGHAAVGSELADRQVLRDATFHVIEPLVVRVEHCPCMHRIQALLGPLRPRDRQQPVEIGPDHGRLGVRVPHALETCHLAVGLLPHRVGHARARNLLTVFVRNGAVVLAKLLANGVHLTAQEILALLFLRAVFHVVSNALAHLQLRQPLPLKPKRQPEPLDDVEGFEQLQLLGEAQVGRVAGGVGQCARVGDGPHERANPSLVSPQLEDLVHDRAVFAFQLAGEAGRRRMVWSGFEVHPKHAVLVSARSAGDRAMEGHQRHGEPAAGEPHALGHLRDDADAGVRVLLPGHQKHLCVAAHVGRQGDRHTRKHHFFIQGNDSQPVHNATRIVAYS